MTQYLPPNLLALFAPRDPIPFKVPVDKLGFEKKRVPYSGVAQFLSHFERPEDTPAPVKVETKDERRERRRKEKAELQAYKIEQGIALWDPNGNERATSDPYKTLFVARINYESSESKLRREFEVYGPIKRIQLIQDKVKNKPRGYAFVEYERERDMHAAYKHADGRKIDGRRVLVDVERGRTVQGWLPRRLGGGLGNTRRARPAGEEESEGSFPVETPTRGGGGGLDRREDRDRGRDRDNRERERDRGERPERDVRVRDSDRDRKKRTRSRSRDRDSKRHRDRETVLERPRDRERDRGERREREPGRERDRDRGDRRERDGKGDRDMKREIKREEGELGSSGADGYGSQNGSNF